MRKVTFCVVSFLMLAGCGNTKPQAQPATPAITALAPTSEADRDRYACHSLSTVIGSDGEVSPTPEQRQAVAVSAARAGDPQVVAAGRQLVDAAQAGDTPATDPVGSNIDTNLALDRAWIGLADACGNLYGDGPW